MFLLYVVIYHAGWKIQKLPLFLFPTIFSFEQLKIGHFITERLFHITHKQVERNIISTQITNPYTHILLEVIRFKFKGRLGFKTVLFMVVVSKDQSEGMVMIELLDFQFDLRPCITLFYLGNKTEKGTGYEQGNNFIVAVLTKLIDFCVARTSITPYILSFHIVHECLVANTVSTGGIVAGEVPVTFVIRTSLVQCFQWSGISLQPVWLHRPSVIVGDIFLIFHQCKGFIYAWRTTFSVCSLLSWRSSLHTLKQFQ